MRKLNLSEWALKHPVLIQFFMVLTVIAGVISYFNMGRAEDPGFTFRVMVVNAQWPGASAQDVQAQLTERIEKKLQEVPGIDYVQSFARSGETYVFVFLRDDVDPKTVSDAWYQARKKLNDIRHTLPAETIGPFFNDEFGDTYGSVYALTADGFSVAELREYAERARAELLRVPQVEKVELLGVQPEKLFITFSQNRLAQLGLDLGTLISTLQAQNIMVPAGEVITAEQRLPVRVSGVLRSEEALEKTELRLNGRSFLLRDVATVSRGVQDPPGVRMRFRGQESIGIAVSMRPGGDIIALGQRLTAAWEKIRADLPVGIDVHSVADQPRVVKGSVNEFMRTLAEAVAIVLIVSFFSLGLRTGLVVALCIPLVLAATFAVMRAFGIDFQKISLGALILALGLLVDDAIIAVEMMLLKLEEGWDRVRAATFAYTSTAVPMLTGTLITAAGFLPVGFAKSAAGEYTFSIFAVVGIALIVSWFVAVLFTPYLGYLLLPRKPVAHHNPYDKPFYQRFRATVEWCVQHRKMVLLVTVLMFVSGVAGFKFVSKQFFPNSTRPEIVVDLWLPETASPAATEAAAKKLDAFLADDPRIDNFVSYLGGGSPRFVLVLDQQMPNPHLAEFVITAKSLAERESLITDLRTFFGDQLPGVRARAARLPNGPPVGYPVQFRVSGPDAAQLRKYADQVADVMRAHPHTQDVHPDWYSKSPALRVNVDQDKARALGVSSQDIATALRGVLSGVTVTQYREGDQLIDVVLRGEEADRHAPEKLAVLNVPVRVAGGRSVPLSQLATLETRMEESYIWRRDRLPTITVRADIPDQIQAPDVTLALWPQLKELEKTFAPGYRLSMGGAQEKSEESQASINAQMPMMLAVMGVVLMLQLQSWGRMTMTVLTAPLGLIGVTAFLLIFNQPFGFVAMLGVIALFGMIIRNAVILVDQIEHDRAEGRSLREAIVDSAVRRFRPIMLTALAAILGMIPLTRSVFFGPMAVAIMGGLLIATVLTLLVLPALYAAWYRKQL